MKNHSIRILEIFNEINRIPRCSKNEDGVRTMLERWASNNNFSYKSDAGGNIVILVPASKGFESAKTIVLQGHMDMVCEKNDDCIHDFSKDPIKSIQKGEWLAAEGTSLGADNGIAIAIAMYLSTSEIEHPSMELLFTYEEEIGLIGANNLEDGFLSGDYLINLDSEDEGTITIGCAGGNETEMSITPTYEKVSGSICTIVIDGAVGGHSGVDINKNRANTNLILASLLMKVREKTNLQIVDIKGGTAFNAIPRSAKATVICNFNDLKELSRELENSIKNQYKKEPDIKVSISKMSGAINAISLTDTDKIIELINSLPNGVNSTFKDFPDITESSSNVATVGIEDEIVKIVTSQRSSSVEKLRQLNIKIDELSLKAGAKSVTSNEYAAWEPNMNSELLKECKKGYFDLFKKKPQVQVMHAGLECGIIGKKFPKLDMISIGPTINSPHSPDERLNIPSIERIVSFLEHLFTLL